MENAVLLTGFFGVLVALIAAGAALIGSRLTSQANAKTLSQAAELERERWGRDDARRHESARREAYPAFLATADEAVLGINRLLALGSLDADFAGPHWPERMRDALNLIEFVGTPETIDLAKRFDRAVHRLITGVVGLKQLTQATPPDGAGDPIAGKTMLDDFDEEVLDDVEQSEDRLGEDDHKPADVGPPVVAYIPDDFSNSGIAGLNAFMATLPYPIGEEIAPHRMYGGHPASQVIMARTELRIRRHEFVNAARHDLGMPAVDYPDETPQFVDAPRAEAAFDHVDEPDGSQ